MGWHIVTGTEAGRWVAGQIMGGYFAERSTAIGLKKDDEFIAGVIYENWNQASIWCHIAIDGRLTPAYLAAIFDYPYNVALVDKIIVPIASDNSDMLKLIHNMGFTEEGRIKDGRPDGDIVFFTLHRDNCRFLGKRYKERLNHGERFTFATATA